MLYICFLRLESILEAFMMVFSFMKLSVLVFIKAKQNNSCFYYFGQMTAVIFLILGNLKLSATVAFSANTFEKTKRVN